jgi:Arc/MetJ-type ribon-helix-helix transcriptional regulator
MANRKRVARMRDRKLSLRLPAEMRDGVERACYYIGHSDLSDYIRRAIQQQLAADEAFIRVMEQSKRQAAAGVSAAIMDEYMRAHPRATSERVGR